jgi:transcriptional regulator with XRE-family HTH domain
MPRAASGSQPPSPGNVPEDEDEAYVLRIKAILKRERLRKGVNFRQLEEATGISFGYLARSERSDNQPTILVFRRWCRALGLKFEDVCKKAAKPG